MKTDPYIILRMTWINPNHCDFNPVYLESATLVQGGLYNGYVAIPEGHPYHGVGYDELNEKINIHGGLTYAEMEGDYWVIGFDTMHFGDTAKRWDVASVAKEAESLLKQVIEAGKPKE